MGNYEFLKSLAWAYKSARSFETAQKTERTILSELIANEIEKVVTNLFTSYGVKVDVKVVDKIACEGAPKVSKYIYLLDCYRNVLSFLKDYHNKTDEDILKFLGEFIAEAVVVEMTN